MKSTVTVQKPSRVKFWMTVTVSAAVLAFLYYQAFTQTNLSFKTPDSSTLRLLGRFIWGPFTNEKTIQTVPHYLNLMVQTVSIAYVGTLSGAILAIPFGFLASRNMTGWFSSAGKSILNGIRAFPYVLFAIIFVSAVGMGPYAGVLAISVNSIGMLGKLYSEAIESIDMEVVRALKATGANPVQVMWYGVMPQVIPEFLSYGLYRYEIDVRASTVLGFVGAGGIGTQMILDANQRNWESIGMMVFIIIFSVIIIDKVSSYLRKKIV